MPTTEVAPERIAVGFARVLRGAGLDVPVGTVVAYAEALGAVGIDSKTGVYWAGRTTLVRRMEDVPLYNRAFGAYWLGRRDDTLQTEPEVEHITLLLDDGEDTTESDEQDGEVEEGNVITVRFSAHEVLRHKDFATYSRSELDEARQLMADLRLAGALRPSRRYRRSRHAKGRPDLRRTVRSALRSGGEPVRREWLDHDERQRRLVLLCDVSGSMEPYARALMRFLHAAVVGRTKVEAFALGTRLTRITRQLSSRDPDSAMAAAADEVADWSGGTRLGDGLKAFNDRYGQRGMARGAIVVILSDGWERGDPEVMAEQMRRLSRVAHRIVWVNPLKASPGYAPLARGMAAALPYIDEFVEGHSLAALQELAEVISK